MGAGEAQGIPGEPAIDAGCVAGVPVILRVLQEVMGPSAASGVFRSFAALCLMAASGMAVADVKDAQWASPQDLKDANNFLKSIPAECAETYAFASKDGKVTIKMICNGQSKGVVVLKGGKIVGVQ